MSMTERQVSVSCEGSRDTLPSFGRRSVGTLCILAVCLVTFSCKKRELVNTDVPGELKFQPAKFADAIPDDYGPLIGVTQNPTDAGWVGLWFQKPDRTITAVFVNVNQGKILEKTLTIPRK